MKHDVLKLLDTNCHLDSTYLQCIDETASNFHIRIQNNGEQLEVYLQRVLHYEYRTVDAGSTDQLIRIDDNIWVRDFISNNPEYRKVGGKEINESDYHHFQITVGTHCFEILAMWCTLFPEFNEAFREQELVKSIIG